MNPVNPISPSQSIFPVHKHSLDAVQKVYDQVIDEINPPNKNGAHMEIGIITSEGACLQPTRLGASLEEYGAHRVGSVTKMFTAFLILKLCKMNIFPKGLDTKVSEIIPEEKINRIFLNPEIANEMTLEQLLSHTSGLENSDHCQFLDPSIAPRSITERFDLEARIIEGSVEGYASAKFQHLSKPLDQVYRYSNGGYAVASWMAEVAYASSCGQALSFSDIMKREILDGVFCVSHKTEIKPGPTNDCMQSAAGDLTTTVEDLQKIGKRIQDDALDAEFGRGWQEQMKRPRGLLGEYGLGCSSVQPDHFQHFGMNRERIGQTELDVTAAICFPIRKGVPGVVAMCDTGALGPKGEPLIDAVKTYAGIQIPKKAHEKAPPQDLSYYLPTPECVYCGTDYIIFDKDPFVIPPQDVLSLSKNGLKYDLHRDGSLDQAGHLGYRDQLGSPWFMLKSKAVYSGSCYASREISPQVVNGTYPSVEELNLISGTYQDEEYPEVDHPVYSFSVLDSHLYCKTEGFDEFPKPCLHVVDDDGIGYFIPSGGDRSIKFHFPSDNGSFVEIKDTATNRKEMPFRLRKISYKKGYESTSLQDLWRQDNAASRVFTETYKSASAETFNLDPELFAEIQDVLSRQFDLVKNPISSIKLIVEPERRNRVLRIEFHTLDMSVIFKESRPQIQSGEVQEEDLKASYDRFARDWAGLEFTSSLDRTDLLCPKLYGGSKSFYFVLQEDLGENQVTLKDHLLGEDLTSASGSLFRYMETLARFHGSSHEKKEEYLQILQEINPKAPEFYVGNTEAIENDFQNRFNQVQDILTVLNIQIGPNLKEEIGEVISSISGYDRTFATLVHGDPCPDNMFDYPDKLLLIDFEWAEIKSALFDATYPRMSMPSAFLAGRFPDDVLDAADRLYREELMKFIPEAGDDAAYFKAYTDACAFHILKQTIPLLNEVLEEDFHWGIASNRSRVISHLETFIHIAKRQESLPSFVSMTEELLKSVKKRCRDSEPLDFYPAFKKS